MNKNVYRSIAGMLVISALLLLWPSVTLAQSGDGPSNSLGVGPSNSLGVGPSNSLGVGPSNSLGASYELSWWTVDGGGSRVESVAPGPYTLAGTIGQPDAAVWQGATYSLAGGFWSGTTVEFYIYLPLVLRHWE